MADSVRRVLEDMVPELEDLEFRGYFSREEIRSIVQKRENFEYNLQRRATLKKDYLRCIDYEESLEMLRLLRKKQRQIAGPNTIADHCIVRRIHSLFDRMTKKFKGDLDLWTKWIKFCEKTRSSKQLSKAVTRALQLHPHCPSLWVYAAAWEFEHNKNASSARALMQRGLRMCKAEPLLWHEYFRMELLYAARLMARRRVLALHDSDMDDATKALVGGAVAKVVFQNAVVSEVDSAKFRLNFLEIASSVSLLNTSELQSYILESIKESFGSDETVIYVLAQRELSEQLSSGASKKDAIKVALLSIPLENSTGYHAYMRFLYSEGLKCIQEEDEEGLEFILELYVKNGQVALSKGYLDEDQVDIIIGVCQAYLRMAMYEKASSWLEACSHSCSAKLISVEMLHLHEYEGLSDTSPEITVKSLTRLLCESPNNRTPDLWLCCLGAVVSCRQSLMELADLFAASQQASVTGGEAEDMGKVATSIATCLWKCYDISRARNFYQRILKGPLPGANFVRNIAALERNLYESKAEDALHADSIRRIYDVGVNVYGRISVFLWLDYYQFELELGKDSKSGMVHWRAVQNVDDADAFIAQAQLRTSGISDAIQKW